MTSFCESDELLAGRDPDHLLDQIDAGDQLGHGMLDLQPRVHFQEIEALVLAGDEFDGAGGIVFHRLRQRDRLFAHLAAGGLVEQRRRRLLDHLLIAALDRTFALAEIDHIAVLVPQHLDFDVAGIDDEFLDEHPVVAERRLGFGLGQTESFGDLGGRIGDPHSLAAAAGGSLDHDGIADRVGDLHGMLFVLDDAEMPRHGRDVGLRRRLLGFDLVAHRGDRAGIGADEDDAGLGQRARKGLALGQKSIAGMHGFRAGLAAGLDDLVDHQIAFGGGRRTDQDRMVGHFDVKGVAVGFGIDGDGLDPHPAGSFDDPAGDLAAICDQNSFEHLLAYLQPLGRDPAPAIWHAGADVTIPSYSKTKRRQRLICRKTDSPAVGPGRPAAGSATRRPAQIRSALVFTVTIRCCYRTLTSRRALPLMRWFILILAIFAASQSFAASPIVRDGGTIDLADVTYRLDGIDAPALDQICIDDHADTWACGVDARDQLASLIGGHEVRCEDLGPGCRPIRSGISAFAPSRAKPPA